MPAGGIEQGETVEQAAEREVREETGLDGIRLVRELGTVEQAGVRDPEFVHESHFVQAAPTVESADEWRHVGMRVRWEQVRAELPLWPQHAELLHELLRERVVGYVTRRRDDAVDLLTIQYPDGDAPVEVPAGRLDPGEDLVAGLAREVEEEAGISGIRVVSRLADADEFERLYGAGAHRSYAFHAEVDDDRNQWEHLITGTGADSGLTHMSRWVPLDECLPLWGKPDPLVEKLRRSITTG